MRPLPGAVSGAPLLLLLLLLLLLGCSAGFAGLGLADG
jgi:hypothetical protein